MTIGLLTRIRHATTAEEIDRLLAEGRDYPNASDRTRNRWIRKARQRKKELDNQQ